MLLTKEIFSIVLQTKHFLLLLKQIHIEDLITNDPKADIVSLRRSGQSLAGVFHFAIFRYSQNLRQLIYLQRLSLKEQSSQHVHYRILNSRHGHFLE